MRCYSEQPHGSNTLHMSIVAILLVTMAEVQEILSPYVVVNRRHLKCTPEAIVTTSPEAPGLFEPISFCIRSFLHPCDLAM